MPAPVRDQTPGLHDRAIQDLSFIRRTMEGAASFTDVPGWGLVIIGATALGAAALARQQPSDGRWLLVWVFEAIAAVLLSVVLMLRKIGRRAGVKGAPRAPLPLPARKFLLGFWPAIAAGAVLTVALIDFGTVWEKSAGNGAVDGAAAIIPGLWLLLYGVGVVTAGAFSVRPVPLMGIVFLALGTATLLLPAPRDLMLALGFGITHIIFGVIIARRHGG